MPGRIFRNLLDLVSGTLISRVLGFLRELVTASYFGTDKAMDLFVIAFTIPTFFRHILGEDVVERAFMPPFKKLISQKKYHSAWRLLSSCLNLMLAVLIVVMVLLYLVAPIIVRLLAPGLEDAIYPQAIKMTYWILPFMLLIGLAAFVGGILNFFEMNKIYSLAPVMLSVGVIVGIILFKPILGMYALPAGFLLGGLGELVIQIPFLFKRQIYQETRASYSPKIDLQEKEFKKVRRESGFILLKSLFDKSVEIVDRQLASFLPRGRIAALWYANRLIELPVAIIGLAISRSLVPYLTEKKALSEESDFLAGIRLGIRLNFLLILPVIAFILVMHQPIISLVYQRGKFDAESTRLTGLAFWCYGVGLLGMSLNAFFSRIFSIFQKNKVPFFTSIFAAVLNIILNLILVKTALKHGGLALASSLAFSTNTLILFYFLHQEIAGKISYLSVLKEFIPTLIISMVTGVIAYLMYHFFIVPSISRLLAARFWQNLISLIVVGGIMVIVFGSLLAILGPEEVKLMLRQLIGKILQRHKR